MCSLKPRDGSYSILFTIYDAAINGNSKWSETQNVTTTNGLFAVLLGSVNPIEDTVFNASERYLALKVESEPEMSPRIMMVTVPYAMRVATVDGATGGTVRDSLRLGYGSGTGDLSIFMSGSGEAALPARPAPSATESPGLSLSTTPNCGRS